MLGSVWDEATALRVLMNLNGSLPQEWIDSLGTLTQACKLFQSFHQFHRSVVFHRERKKFFSREENPIVLKV
jgi:hypothetical protein